MPDRLARQKWISEFIANTWGETNMHPQERAMRLLEEAIELAQVEGVTARQISELTSHVMGKPPGSPSQETGGVGVCLLAYCEAKGLSADAAEGAEIERLKTRDPEHFRRRHQVKVDAGVAQQGISPDAPTE